MSNTYKKILNYITIHLDMRYIIYGVYLDTIKQFENNSYGLLFTQLLIKMFFFSKIQIIILLPLTNIT